MHSPAVYVLSVNWCLFLDCIVLADGDIKLLEKSMTLYGSASLEDFSHRHYSCENLGYF
jgi:hypothetical protein